MDDRTKGAVVIGVVGIVVVGALAALGAVFASSMTRKDDDPVGTGDPSDASSPSAHSTPVAGDGLSHLGIVGES